MPFLSTVKTWEVNILDSLGQRSKPRDSKERAGSACRETCVMDVMNQKT